VSEVLTGVRPVFTFASQVTLLLNHRQSGDQFLAQTPVRTVAEDSTSWKVLDFLASLRRRRVGDLQCLVLRSGDHQGLRAAPEAFAATAYPIKQLGAVAVSPAGDLLHIVGDHALRTTHAGFEPLLSLSEADRLLKAALAELTSSLENDRRLIGLGAPPLEPPLELPEGFSAPARRVATTASAVLVLASGVRTLALHRDRSASQILDLLSHAEHAAVRALTSVITQRTLV